MSQHTPAEPESKDFVRRAFLRKARARLPVWLCCGLRLENPPRRGVGEDLHGWLFSTARQLHPHFEQDEIISFFSAVTEADEREISDAVVNSAAYAWRPSRKARRGPRPHHTTPAGSQGRMAQVIRSHLAKPKPAPAPAKPKWPEPDLQKIERIVAETRPLAALPERGCSLSTADLLRQLFTEDDLLCLGLSNEDFCTLPLQEWLTWEHLNLFQFIVPSPMSKPAGQTRRGYLSPHCLDNCGPRKCLVVEFDWEERGKDGKDTVYGPLIRRWRAQGISLPEAQSRVLAHLAEYRPLVLVVHSGGKSLQGWFFAQGEPEEELLKFMRYAVRLGADDATWTRCQFVRMPGGTRYDHKTGQPVARQEVRYFDPEELL